MALLHLVAISDEIVDEQRVLVLPFELDFTQTADCVKGFTLNLLQDLVFCLFILADCLTVSLCISFPSSLKLLKNLQVELLSNDLLDDPVVEECDLPIILMETFREILEVALLQVHDVLG